MLALICSTGFPTHKNSGCRRATGEAFHLKLAQNLNYIVSKIKIYENQCSLLDGNSMPCGLLLLISGFMCFQDMEAMKFSKYQPKKTMI